MQKITFLFFSKSFIRKDAKMTENGHVNIVYSVLKKEFSHDFHAQKPERTKNTTHAVQANTTL